MVLIAFLLLAFLGEELRYYLLRRRRRHAAYDYHNDERDDDSGQSGHDSVGFAERVPDAGRREARDHAADGSGFIRALPHDADDGQHSHGASHKRDGLGLNEEYRVLHEEGEADARDSDDEGGDARNFKLLLVADLFELRINVVGEGRGCKQKDGVRRRDDGRDYRCEYNAADYRVKLLRDERKEDSVLRLDAGQEYRSAEADYDKRQIEEEKADRIDALRALGDLGSRRGEEPHDEDRRAEVAEGPRYDPRQSRDGRYLDAEGLDEVGVYLGDFRIHRREAADLAEEVHRHDPDAADDDEGAYRVGPRDGLHAADRRKGDEDDEKYDAASRFVPIDEGLEDRDAAHDLRAEHDYRADDDEKRSPDGELFAEASRDIFRECVVSGAAQALRYPDAGDEGGQYRPRAVPPARPAVKIVIPGMADHARRAYERREICSGKRDDAERLARDHPVF